MDSDEEIVDSYDDDDYYYSDADADDCVMSELVDDVDDDDVDIGCASDDIDVVRPEKNYEVLKESDIKLRQEESILHVSSVLSIPRVVASILLCYYRWNVSQLHDAWFADEESVRKAVGLLNKPIVGPKKAKKLACGICFDSFSPSKICSAFCGHPYCKTCWKGYVTTSINDGPGCLLLRCPDPSCRAAVSQDMIIDLASNGDKKKFYRCLVRSYIEDKKKVKWCPAPDCENAVKLEPGSDIYDVTCHCSHAFCWNCAEEAHRPVDCSTVSKWILKNSAEAENMNWIIANSKPCPKCKRAIEKSHGCMHMTCTPPCKFQFCWLCLGDWTTHGERTGGFYACNRYEAAKAEGLYNEEEKKREMAKNSLERYTHYYERWESNQKSKVKAIQDLHEMRTVHLAKLSDQLKEPETQLKFIIEAWLQIIECRRVLKWTYAYGYYLPENEHAKVQLFEYLQGEAEAGLERLHQCAEKELAEYLPKRLWNEDKEVEARKNFISFRPKLAGLTRVTQSYFENLVKALESGLADVKSQADCSTSKKGKAKEGKGGKRGKGKSSTSRSDPVIDLWNCDRCTYANPSAATVCQICLGQR